MPEPTYRRNQDGMMTEVTPQAQGKAAALSAYLARGGTPFKTSGRFAKGPMKGKNVDEATAEFERMWASSPDSVKQKYASRSSGATTDLAPSERKVQGVTPAPLQGTAQSRRMAFYGHEMGPDGVARKIGAVSPTPKTPTAPAPGSDEARAVALTENSRNERFATASVGNYMDMRAAVSAGRGDLETAAADEAIAQRDKGVEAARQSAYAQSEQARVAEKNRIAAEKAGVSIPGTNAPVATPPQAPARAPQAPAPITVATRPPMSPARPMALLPDPTVQGITRPEAPTGKAVMTRPERDTARSQIKGRVNRLTGLPGGYLPGDALPQGADATMQQRANDSTTRQSINTSAAMPPRAVPVTRPTPMPGVEQRAANEMRRQAGINANPSTVNQDDPRKFFTGKVKPLDQLVKTQRVQGITPPRR